MSGVVQQNLFDASIVGLKKFKQKRVHLKEVTYVKKYKIQIHYNDDEQSFMYDSDEKHIFRIKTLHNIHYAIYVLIKFRIINKNENITDVILHQEDEQAEIKNTWNLSIKERVLLHIELLRLLRKGVNVEKAVEFAKSKTKTILRRIYN